MCLGYAFPSSSLRAYCCAVATLCLPARLSSHVDGWTAVGLAGVQGEGCSGLANRPHDNTSKYYKAKTIEEDEDMGRRECDGS